MTINQNGDIIHTGEIINTGDVGISAGSNLTLFDGTLNCSAVSTVSITTATLTCNSSITAETFGPTYKILPTLTGKIGQAVGAGQPAKTLVYNNSIEVRSLTIPYTGVWLIDMSIYLGNAGALTGDIKYPTSIRINGNVTHNFYGTNVTGVNGCITRNLNINDVVSFNTYLTGANASSMTASQRVVYGTGYTFLTATRIA